MSSLSDLRELVARLRRDCPWDRAQTHANMRPYLMEEAFEALDAIDSGDPARMREELGDLLFQVFFHARLGEEAGHFDMEQIAADIVTKMVERHPHVFEDARLPGGPSVWEARKAARRVNTSRVDGVPRALPALQRAHRVGEKVSHVGFDWPEISGVYAKIQEELAELEEARQSGDAAAIRHEYGDLLLSCASLGRFLGVSGEDALREANARFERRFRAVEAQASAAGVPLEGASPQTLDGWWEQAKEEVG